MALKMLPNRCRTLLEVTKCFNNFNIAYSGKVQIKLMQPNKKKFVDNLKANKNAAISTLVHILDIQKPAATDLVIKNVKLSIVPSKTINDNFQVLKDSGITSTMLIQYPQLLSFSSTNDLKDNLESIKQLPFEFNDCLCLATLEKNNLQKIINSPNFLPRVDLMMRKLNTSVNVIMEGLTMRPFLLKISLARLEQIIDLLNCNNVCSSDIVKDWWVLQYTPKIIQERIEFCQKHNIDPFKTWMVRCTDNILERYIQRRSDNKLVLGENTLAEYLTQRLQCTSEETRNLVLKHPALQNKSMKKLKEIIDFLLAEGFQPYHIRRIPKILLHSVQTTKKRLRELEQQGVKMHSLHMLTKSQRQYMRYYQALVKSNDSKIQIT